MRPACLISFLTVMLGVRLLVADPVHLQCNHLQNPLGIDSARPRLSWQNDSTERNWHQSAYQVVVSTTGQGDVWDSGKVKGAQSVGIAYAGPALQSRRRYFWRVRVWDASDRASSFAPSSWWEMGLLSSNEWQAKWITRNNPEEVPDRAAMHWLSLPGQKAQNVPPKITGVFRKEFQLDVLPQRAALFVIGHGNYVAVINGHEVTSKTDWSDFDRKDISKELQAGSNTIELRLTSIEVSPYAPPTKYHPTVIAALIKLHRKDNSILRIGTDSSWQTHGSDGEPWTAAAVAGDLDDETLNAPGPLPQPAALFRHDFKAENQIASARLYISALGSYRVAINGENPSKGLLTPDFTDYRKRLEYQTYDVTALVKKGENAVGIELGDGWYGSPMTWMGSHLFAPPNRVTAQLELRYTNGKKATIATDSGWRTSESPIVFSQIYAGEDYDARLQQKGWSRAKFDDSGWAAASTAVGPSAQLTGLTTPPVHINRQLKPEGVKPSNDGSYIFDFGQNMVGWTELKVQGPAGTRVRLRFAEILNPDGTVYTKNLRNADATDTYTLDGDGRESYAPAFTFHGFRYVEVSGYPGTPTLDDLTGVVAGSLDEPPSVQIQTSSDLVNRMWAIGLWGQRGNFVSIPTDCPQRDERLGWMGDAGVFWRTGTYNFDLSAFTRKFMLDVDDAQNPQGDFSNVSPDLLHADMPGAEGAPGWSDAGVIVPYTAWLQYGDSSYIDDNWDAMQRFMQYIAKDNLDFIRKNGNGPNFADWLAPDPHSPNELVATAYWALSARMMMQMAHATGREQDAAQYQELISNIRSAYDKAFVKVDGEVAGNTQTAYLLTLYTKMAPETLEKTMADRLVADIQAHGGHLSTGFLGTPFLLFTLADYGHSDMAYKLLLNETYPSWGYMLSKGATTWWERWNGDTGDPAMNSFNHYAFGSVMAWVYRSVLGIDTAPDGAGFQHIVIHPQPGPGINQARGEYASAYGKIVTDWKVEGGVFTLQLQIPANTSATVTLPATAGSKATQDGKPLSDYAAEVGSGTYRFEVRSAL